MALYWVLLSRVSLYKAYLDTRSKILCVSIVLLMPVVRCHIAHEHACVLARKGILVVAAYRVVVIVTLGNILYIHYCGKCSNRLRKTSPKSEILHTYNRETTKTRACAKQAQVPVW